MATVTKSKTKDKCPRCGTVLVEINVYWDPFPGEKGSLQQQTSRGCSECGYQRVISTYADYDEYLSPEENKKRETPITFGKENFKL